MPPADTLQETKDRTIIECMDALVPHIVTGCPVYMSELVGLGGPRAGSGLRPDQPWAHTTQAYYTRIKLYN